MTTSDYTRGAEEPKHTDVTAAIGTESDSRRAAISYYDETYHREHYGHLFNEDYYGLVAGFWRYALFDRTGMDANTRVLDYGCGLGQVTAALPNSTCFDISRFAISELRRRGRVIVEDRERIPVAAFDIVLSSHALEHSTTPYEDLKQFRQYLRPEGRLLLILPIESEWKPTLESDWNQHLFAWTFQTITNLLRAAGWTPLLQRRVQSPYMLRTLSRIVSDRKAIRGAYAMGKIRDGSPSILTIAKIAS